MGTLERLPVPTKRIVLTEYKDQVPFYAFTPHPPLFCIPDSPKPVADWLGEDGAHHFSGES